MVDGKTDKFDLGAEQGHRLTSRAQRERGGRGTALTNLDSQHSIRGRRMFHRQTGSITR